MQKGTSASRVPGEAPACSPSARRRLLVGFLEGLALSPQSGARAEPLQAPQEGWALLTASRQVWLLGCKSSCLACSGSLWTTRSVPGASLRWWAGCRGTGLGRLPRTPHHPAQLESSRPGAVLLWASIFSSAQWYLTCRPSHIRGTLGSRICLGFGWTRDMNHLNICFKSAAGRSQLQHRQGDICRP